MTASLHPALSALARPCFLAGVGSGISAAGAVAGGADLLAVYNTAIYRMRNLPSILAFLPGDDPNRITLDAAPAVIANAQNRPVIVGLSAHNPQVDVSRLLDELERSGGRGVTNEPFAGLYGPAFNAELDRVGCGFAREKSLIEAGVRRGLLALGWACDADQAAAMADVGAPLIGLMLGITQAGASDALDHAVRAIAWMAAAARRANPTAWLLIHGGPLERPEGVAHVLSRCDVDGYVTGSSLERGPVLAAVTDRMRAFRSAVLRKE